MVSTWSSGTTLPTSAYGNTVTGDFNAGVEFTFVDFLPECRKPGGIFTNPKFETFRTLIDRANDWLRSNPTWEVKTCESIEFKSRLEHVNYEKMTYIEHGEAGNRYIRGLRLWITRRAYSDRAQQIGYLNLIPQQLGSPGLFSSSTYENLQEVVDRFNSMIRSKPLPGRIINVESQEMKLKRGGLDPDVSTWMERGDYANVFLFVIRIFYEIMSGNPEEIGIVDFLPNAVKKGGIFTLPDYEPFSYVIRRASDWCSRQNGLRFCNAQSLEIKVNSGSEPNSQKMSYTEHGNRSTFYVRILRVAYAKAPPYSAVDHPLPLTQLTCKTIPPVQLTMGFFVPDFESLSQTKTRISAWIRATGAKVISAETSAMRISTGGEARHGTEASFTYNRAERNEYWVFVFRLYLDGQYREPPPEMLPPYPEIDTQTCCALQ